MRLAARAASAGAPAGPARFVHSRGSASQVVQLVRLAVGVDQLVAPPHQGPDGADGGLAEVLHDRLVRPVGGPLGAQEGHQAVPVQGVREAPWGVSPARSSTVGKRSTRDTTSPTRCPAATPGPAVIRGTRAAHSRTVRLNHIPRSPHMSPWSAVTRTTVFAAQAQAVQLAQQRPQLVVEVAGGGVVAPPGAGDVLRRGGHGVHPVVGVGPDVDGVRAPARRGRRGGRDRPPLVAVPVRGQVDVGIVGVGVGDAEEPRPGASAPSARGPARAARPGPGGASLRRSRAGSSRGRGRPP